MCIRQLVSADMCFSLKSGDRTLDLKARNKYARDKVLCVVLYTLVCLLQCVCACAVGGGTYHDQGTIRAFVISTIDIKINGIAHIA